MSTFYAGAGSKLAAGLQTNYFANSGDDVDTLINMTSATFDPSVEKGSEETLLQSIVKNGSYLLSIGMDASFDANLRPEMTHWLFRAVTQNATYTTVTDDVPSGYEAKEYKLKDAGNDPLGSTFVLQKGAGGDAIVTTYPGMTVRSFTLNAPNNDFVTVSCDLAGREEIKAGSTSQITTNTAHTGGSTYVTKDFTDVEEYTLPSYIVTNGVFKWNNTMWCIESSTLTIDNGIEDSPRCYQDGKYVNIPVMGMRAVNFDFNLPYDSKIETLKSSYLLTSQYGSAELTFTSPDDANEKIVITIPNLSITSVGSGISGTGVIEASVSGEAVQVAPDDPITIFVQTKTE